MKNKYLKLLGTILIGFITSSAFALSTNDLLASNLRQSASVSWSLTDSQQSITITNYTSRTKHYIISVATDSNPVRVVNCNDNTISLKKSSSVNCSITSGSTVVIRNDGNATASGTYQDIT